MTDAELRDLLVDQLLFDWDHLFWNRMDGLTDEEYLWRPVPECWTVQPDGTVDSLEPGAPEPDPAPFTTMAWRIHHIAEFFTERWSNHFDDGSAETPVALTAAEGLANVREAYERWRNALQSMPPERISAPCGPAEGPFAREPFAALILHINREMIHHGAECCLLRDLYLHQVRGD